MTENVKDGRLAEMDKIFKINNPKYKDTHFTSIKEVKGFYVASIIDKRPIEEIHPYAYAQEYKRALYFILPKDNKSSKGAVIEMISHPAYDWDVGRDWGTNPESTDIRLNIEGKEVARVWEGKYIDVADKLLVRQLLREHKEGRSIIKFLNKFVIDKEEVRQKRREDLKSIKNGFEEMVGKGASAIKNKIEHLRDRCRKVSDRITENVEQAKEKRKVKKTINYYTKSRGRNKMKDII